jgi:ABC-type lipoprotein release transport system permease subunit
LTVGLLAAAGAGGVIRRSVLGASLEPGAFVTATLLLAATALLAAYLPARHALGIEPATALRDE